jgi:hypothetical protein
MLGLDVLFPQLEETYIPEYAKVYVGEIDSDRTLYELCCTFDGG